jgi:hypothetical protein
MAEQSREPDAHLAGGFELVLLGSRWLREAVMLKEGHSEA